MRQESRGVVRTRVDQAEDARDEEQEVQGQVERRLRARPQVDVHEVRAHVPGLRQGVGAAHHEQRAVQHVVEVEDPGRRGVEDVALEDLDGDHEGQGDDQPGEGLARPVADLVDGADETSGRHQRYE